jgi:hypothetical protein
VSRRCQPQVALRAKAVIVRSSPMVNALFE